MTQIVKLCRHPARKINQKVAVEVLLGVYTVESIPISVRAHVGLLSP